MQRSQLTRISKEELIESILSAPDQEGEQISTLTTALQNLLSEVAGLKNAICAPVSIINKRLTGLQLQVKRQAAIRVKQPNFLEPLDRKEREKNVVILRASDENGSLNTQTSDACKITTIWLKIEVHEEIA